MPNRLKTGRYGHRVYRRTGQLKRRMPVVQGGLVAHGFGYTNVLLSMCVLTIGGLYLMTINASAVRGSQLYDMEKKVVQLKIEQEELRIREAELRVESQSQDRLQKLGMKEIDTKNYIVVEEDLLALDY